MKVPYSVLKQFIPDLALTPEQVGELFTMRSYEVEEVENLSDGLDKVVVGKILEITSHPDADRLQLTKVDVGAGEPLGIVCGAKNLQVGQLVPVATVGAVLPGDFKIKKSKIRGETSMGMLCSARELGLGVDHEGIYILSGEAEIGQPVAEALGLSDAVIEIDNKGLGTRAGDSSSFYGLARELGMILGHKVKTLPADKLPKKPTEYTIRRDSEICSYYSLLDVTGLAKYDYGSNVHEHQGYRVDLYVQVDSFKIDPAVRKVLERVGINTRIPAVDMGNYIMEETGQPVHVFDADKLDGKDIIIRKATKRETMVTLDGTEITLEDGDIVICDSEKIIALGGIIGSKNSAVDESTKHVVVESANFDANQIRTTARRLKLLTGAAKRFERGIPVELAQVAQQRAQWFFKEDDIEVVGFSESGSATSKVVSTKLSFDYVRKYIGVDIKNSEIEKILDQIGATVEGSLGGKDVTVKAPYWRIDLETPEEYIEEVARVYGYDNIPAKQDFAFVSPSHDPEYRAKRTYTESLAGMGYTEIITYAYTDTPSTHQMINPVDGSKPFLRETLAPAMAEARDRALIDLETVSLVEISKVFGPTEHLRLVMTKGAKEGNLDQHMSELYRDFLKASMTLGIQVTGFDFTLTETGATITYNKAEIGWIDATHQTLEVSITDLLHVADILEDTFEPLAKYPAAKRDITITQPAGTLVKHVYDILVANQPKTCETIQLIDTYTAESEVKYTFHLRFRHPDRSLSDEEVNEHIANLESKF